MVVVTVGGPRGGGREEVAQEVAQLLRAELVDREAMAREAQRLAGAPREEMAKRFEQGPAGGRLARAVQAFLERSATAGSAGDPFLGPTGVEILLSRSVQEAAAPATTPKQELDDRRYLEVLTLVTREVAAAGNVVIVGGGSQFILRDSPGALRVYSTASLKDRVRRAMEAEHLDEAAAARLVKEADEARRAWVKKYFKADVDDHLLYDVTINTSILPVKVAGLMLAEAARAKQRLFSG
ncbi:MAG: cytidylate kinase-like family protein [Chloroflexi bacterium]|nr:cytidylate kinase-like family protein [Chloroflexota bacterium]